jgi:hypothetical protein
MNKTATHHRRPNGVPQRQKKPMEQIFEQLDATHPEAKATESAPEASAAVSLKQLAAIMTGAALLTWLLLRKR